MNFKALGFASFWTYPFALALFVTFVFSACKSVDHPGGNARYVPEMEEDEETPSDSGLSLADGKTSGGLPAESFFLKSVGLARCLTLKGGRVIDIACNEDVLKRFAALSTQGPVQFSLKSDGTCIHASQSKTGASFVALQSACSASMAQLWTVRPEGEDQYSFQNLAHPSLCLTAPRFSKSSFELTPCSDTDFQKFTFLNPAAPL
ncbi:MAG: RICIN domain-containing protein [Chitinophagaceae bacterium]|nr:RICIN domain-containing protein [Oligoflexus sp.]